MRSRAHFGVMRRSLGGMSYLRPRFSLRQYRGRQTAIIPFNDKTVTVTTCGRICFNRQKVNLSQLFAGQTVGVKQIQDQIWLVSFMDYDLGCFVDETC